MPQIFVTEAEWKTRHDAVKQAELAYAEALEPARPSAEPPPAGKILVDAAAWKALGEAPAALAAPTQALKAANSSGLLRRPEECDSCVRSVTVRATAEGQDPIARAFSHFSSSHDVSPPEYLRKNSVSPTIQQATYLPSLAILLPTRVALFRRGGGTC
jgi:hypothetical protein